MIVHNVRMSTPAEDYNAIMHVNTVNDDLIHNVYHPTTSVVKLKQSKHIHSQAR